MGRYGHAIALLLAGCACRLDEEAVAWTDERPPAAPIVSQGRVRLRHEGDRLLVDAHGTEFAVDTGAVMCALSSCTPLAREARLVRGSKALVGADTAYVAVLDSLRIGSIDVTKLPVLLVDRTHGRALPVNVIGAAVVAPLLCVHDRDGWWLRERGSWSAGPGDREVELATRGYPLVELVGEAGERVFGVIDTGAPAAYGYAEWVGKRLRVGDLAFTVEKRLDGPRPVIDGKTVDILIGMRVLARRHWVLDLANGRWWLSAG